MPRLPRVKRLFFRVPLLLENLGRRPLAMEGVFLKRAAKKCPFQLPKLSRLLVELRKRQKVFLVALRICLKIRLNRLKIKPSRPHLLIESRLVSEYSKPARIGE